MPIIQSDPNDVLAIDAEYDEMNRRGSCHSGFRPDMRRRFSIRNGRTLSMNPRWPTSRDSRRCGSTIALMR